MRSNRNFGELFYSINLKKPWFAGDLTQMWLYFTQIDWLRCFAIYFADMRLRCISISASTWSAVWGGEAGWDLWTLDRVGTCTHFMRSFLSPSESFYRVYPVQSGGRKYVLLLFIWSSDSLLAKEGKSTTRRWDRRKYKRQERMRREPFDAGGWWKRYITHAIEIQHKYSTNTVQIWYKIQ